MTENKENRLSLQSVWHRTLHPVSDYFSFYWFIIQMDMKKTESQVATKVRCDWLNMTPVTLHANYGQECDYNWKLMH